MRWVSSSLKLMLCLLVIFSMAELSPVGRDGAEAAGKAGIVAIDGGEAYSVLLKSDGTVWTWGNNEYGQLGIDDSGTDESGVPVQAGAGLLPPITAIAAGKTHVLALAEDGTVWGWGYNGNGALGDGTFEDVRYAPVQVQVKVMDQLIPLHDIISLAAGSEHSLAVRDDGTVWAWGGNDFHQLGAHESEYSNNLPQQIFVDDDATEPLSGIVSVTAGYGHSLALSSDGSIWGWGLNDSGQLGIDTYDTAYFPIQVLKLAQEDPLEFEPLQGVASIAAGGSHSLALLHDGTVWAWGAGYSGQNGMLEGENRSVAEQIGSMPRIISIAAGTSHSVAAATDGSVWSWGSNEYGQIADDEAEWSAVPVRVSEITDAEAVFAGYNHSLALGADGSLWAWGRNSEGQHGDGTALLKRVPVLTEFNGPFAQISSGESHTIAHKSDGSVWAWGMNGSGQLGDGTQALRTRPVQVRSGDGQGYLTDVEAVSTGAFGSLALLENGTVLGWGNNTYGQLGNQSGDGENVVLPAVVPGLNNIAAIAAGAIHNLALDEDGRVWSWGFNYQWVLANGTDLFGTSEPALVRVGGDPMEGVIAIAAGDSSSYALKEDGTVWGWGDNFHSQLGFEDAVTAAEPRLINFGSPGVVIQAIASKGMTVYALDEDGSVWSWGLNGYGQLGAGLGDGKSSIPVKVVDAEGNELSNITAIAAGGFHGIALDSDGSAWSWGYNETGQLGVGTNDNHRMRASKVAGVNGAGQLDGVREIAAGGIFSLAVTGSHELVGWGSAAYGELGEGTTANKHRPSRNPFFESLSAANALSTVSFTGVSLSPSFTSEIMSYTGTAGSGTSSVNLSLTKVDESSSAEVRVNGGALAEVSDGEAGPLLLNNGFNLIEIIVTAENGSKRTYAFSITRASVQQVIVPAPAVTGNASRETAVVFGGTPMNATVTSQTNASGQQVTVVKVDETLVAGVMATASNPVVRLEVSTADPAVKVEIPVNVLQRALGKSHDAAIEVVVDGASYTIPAALLKGEPNNAVVSIHIAKVTDTKTREVQEVAALFGLRPVAVSPIDFRIEINGVALTYLGGTYVERTMHIPVIQEAVAPNLMAVRVSERNQLEFVPSEVSVTRDGAVVTMRSPSNSVYTVVEWTKKSFADVQGHWAQKDIEQLAGRLIVSGRSSSRFAPDRDVTRAEFAALLVRSLGLSEHAGAEAFIDVEGSEWFAGAVGAAYMAGLVEGFADGAFRPSDNITREQMAVMVMRALRFAGLETAAADASKLEVFADRGDIAVWARESAAEAVSAGLMNGMSGVSFAPKSHATRAQAASMLKRLMEKAGFIPAN